MILIDFRKKLKIFEMDVSLRLGREITVLTGPNGSGKSTLLRVVAGLVKPDSGEIAVNGVTYFDENTNLPPEERNSGYIPHGNSLFPWLTVEKNVLFGLTKNFAFQEKKWIQTLYSELDMTHLKKRYPSTLSGGEAQKALLARALARRPRILLLDEPLSAVDMAARPRIRSFIREVQKDWGIPVIMVTHDQAEAHIMADRAFELFEGKISATTERGKIEKVPMVSY
ncbi:MAG: ATP-binding cassette domain-containing protein [Thermodesulfobacteriota bacterium]